MNGKGLKETTKLHPIKRSHKDWSTAKTLGVIPPGYFPEEYLLVSTILNQGSDNKCSAAASEAVKESETGRQYIMDWYYAKEMQEQGSVDLSGTDLRTSLKTGVRRGHLPLQYLPFGMTDKPFPYKADWRNWDSQLDAYADKDGTYFMVDGPEDLFDDCRSALLLNKETKTALKGGTIWYDEWTFAPGGFIPTTYSQRDGGHEVKIAGWTTRNGEPVMVIQNSWGNLGDGGLYYFPRSVFNKEFSRYGVGYALPFGREEFDVRTLGRIKTLCQQLIDLLNKLLHPLGLFVSWKP